MSGLGKANESGFLMHNAQLGVIIVVKGDVLAVIS